MIEPVYVARMVLFLASDDAAMCTAQNFLVEGGTV
jgi:NAD(P)-dependent dehydrogenase (short-subunit alcohol dehydrogenase family)